MLHLAGRTTVSTVGGASGPLYGTYFLALGGAFDGAVELDAAILAMALARGGEAVGRRGRSQPGEKTMLDALVPAAEAARTAAADGADLRTAAQRAAEAAEDGRAATIPMIATKGRASYLGERSRGHADPGATSAAILLAALVAAIGQDADGSGESLDASR